MKRIFKKVEVNSGILKHWMDVNEMSHTDVASKVGLSVMQITNLTKTPAAGSQSIAHLSALNIPSLFSLVTYEVKGKKAKAIFRQPMIITIKGGSNEQE